MDREVWQATVHGVAKSRTRLSKHTHTHRGFPRKWASLTSARPAPSDPASSGSATSRIATPPRGRRGKWPETRLVQDYQWEPRILSE